MHLAITNINHSIADITFSLIKLIYFYICLLFGCEFKLGLSNKENIFFSFRKFMFLYLREKKKNCNNFIYICLLSTLCFIKKLLILPNIWHSLTQQAVPLSIEICKIFLLKLFLGKQVSRLIDITLSSIDRNFLPNLLFVMWNVNILIGTKRCAIHFSFFYC